ncbi:glycosyltransferase family 2 protein [Oscillibacter sp. 1-3]|uniref:glycosyltransferase family 2 protein n=1 Tax=Oscillibacter sp. 1-3 TaxID=1235797 RepID=UPI00033971BF|nr:glycosyltransferase family 2 protein [Oscillibacter sp. 1-3]EOS64178.1 hypothetical protein C816_03045 [Oscillibacter sp. 1-3]
MKEPIMITICTLVYNTRPYIRQCVESVLNQTYPYFEYYLIDNGSVDGCKEILEEYAAKDNRIKLIRHEKNSLPAPGSRVPHEYGVGRYYTTLDSDDWWEPDFLEHMLWFAEENRLEIACTGTVMHHVKSGTKSLRKLEEPLILSRAAFADALPWYHVFFRPLWGKLIRMECLRAESFDAVPALPYGMDTLWSFKTLRHAGRMGIDKSVLHHYRIFEKSLSYRYDRKRFQTDVLLYSDAIDFLSAFGPVSSQNRNFLQCVYSNAVIDTTGVIRSSALSPADKLREYRAIAADPITQTAYRECTDKSAQSSRTLLLQRALEAGAALEKQGDEDLRAVAQMLLPRCGQAVSKANTALFLEEPKLLDALYRDAPDDLVEDLLSRLEKNQSVKKYALAETIQALAVNHPFLCQIGDAVFLRKYGDLYRMIWRGETLDALDQMTGLLLEDQVSGGRETFLQLYICLSASLEQASAFIFGKCRLAQLYFRQNRLQECQSIVDEFAEMGLSDHEDIKRLRHMLGNR